MLHGWPGCPVGWAGSGAWQDVPVQAAAQRCEACLLASPQLLRFHCQCELWKLCWLLMRPCAAWPPQIMWEAAKLPGGKQEWADIALQHMRTVTKELFRCRPAAAAYRNGTCVSCSLTCLWGCWSGSRTSKPLRHGMVVWLSVSSPAPCLPPCSHQAGRMAAQSTWCSLTPTLEQWC